MATRAQNGELLSLEQHDLAHVVNRADSVEINAIAVETADSQCSVCERHVDEPVRADLDVLDRTGEAGSLDGSSRNGIDLQEAVTTASVADCDACGIQIIILLLDITTGDALVLEDLLPATINRGIGANLSSCDQPCGRREEVLEDGVLRVPELTDELAVECVETCFESVCASWREADEGDSSRDEPQAGGEEHGVFDVRRRVLQTCSVWTMDCMRSDSVPASCE